MSDVCRLYLILMLGSCGFLEPRTERWHGGSVASSHCLLCHPASELLCHPANNLINGRFGDRAGRGTARREDNFLFVSASVRLRKWQWRENTVTKAAHCCDTLGSMILNKKWELLRGIGPQFLSNIRLCISNVFACLFREGETQKMTSGGILKVQ